MNSPEERVKIAISESDRLKVFLRSLPPESWSKPSACDLWDVSDVVAHLACVAEAYTARIYKSLTPEGESDAGPVSAASFAEGNAEQAISRRRELGNQVFSNFVKTNDELNQLMTTLVPQDWDKPHYYASLGTEPMRFRPDLWISELVTHGWDIRSALELEAHLSEDILPVLMDVLSGQLTRFRFSPRPRLPAPIRYRWELTGAGARNSDIVVEGDKVSIEAAGTGKADVTFYSDTETFYLIALGRLTTGNAVALDRLMIQGDNRLAYEFQGWF